ncbi:hypothetical protein Cgig2_031483 [Carnegiea gigantea]|uniref:RNA polymerase II transcriptional coactivator KELP n=1 Tax=Carnegiea gigantea TaxID=171969 RepID=A0A9Q1QBZ5_9CARY|nr:hypothetical protein Cgig2_031483 [Carnegiea gigantea]
MTEYKVRKQAADKLGIDLSAPSRKKFVRQVVESFLQEQQAAEAQAQQNQNDAAEEEEQQEEEEEEEEDGHTRRSDGKEYDEEGDLILCKLSEKRRVTLQDFRGRTLVSIREYYKKDGKFLPTSKGTNDSYTLPVILRIDMHPGILCFWCQLLWGTVLCLWCFSSCRMFSM